MFYFTESIVSKGADTFRLMTVCFTLYFNAHFTFIVKSVKLELLLYYKSQSSKTSSLGVPTQQRKS